MVRPWDEERMRPVQSLEGASSATATAWPAGERRGREERAGPVGTGVELRKPALQALNRGGPGSPPFVSESGLLRSVVARGANTMTYDEYDGRPVIRLCI